MIVLYTVIVFKVHWDCTKGTLGLNQRYVRAKWIHIKVTRDLNRGILGLKVNW